MAAFMAAAAALVAAGAVSGWFTERAAAKAQQRAAKYSAELAENRAVALEQKANVEAAIGQRIAINQRRLGRYVRSSAIARAGASGVDPSSPDVTNILGDIDREAELRALTALYQGTEAERVTRYAASLERAEASNLRYAGKVARRLGEAQANANLLKGAGQSASLGYSAYAGTTPATTTQTNNTSLYTNYGGGGFGQFERHSYGDGYT